MQQQHPLLEPVASVPEPAAVAVELTPAGDAPSTAQTTARQPASAAPQTAMPVSSTAAGASATAAAADASGAGAKLQLLTYCCNQLLACGILQQDDVAQLISHSSSTNPTEAAAAASQLQLVLLAANLQAYFDRGLVLKAELALVAIEQANKCEQLMEEQLPRSRAMSKLLQLVHDLCLHETLKIRRKNELVDVKKYNIAGRAMIKKARLDGTISAIINGSDLQQQGDQQ